MLNYEQYPLFLNLDRCYNGSLYLEDIKSAIRKTGVSLTELCRSANILVSLASNALALRITKGEVTIDNYLQLPVQLLFPTQWNVDRLRVRLRNAAKYTTVAELLS